METPIKELDVDGVKMLVLSRPRRDVDKWNNLGGRLVSSVDQRISVSAPKNAFRLTTEIALQVVLSATERITTIHLLSLYA